MLRRRLPAALGGATVWVSPDAALKLLARDVASTDPLLFNMAARLTAPGAVVWDVGANVGLFALASAFHAGPRGHVLAIEADEWLAALVRRSAAGLSSRYAPVEVLSVAAADRLGLADFAIAARGRAGNHLANLSGSSQTGGERERRKVVTLTLDWLATQLPPPAVVKIDVEGAELQVLTGARQLLAAARPRLFLEVSDQNVEAVTALLHEARYRLFDAASTEPIERAAWNTLALPEETSP